MNQVEDEYHFPLVCPYYRDLKLKFLPKYYCYWPSITKFENILCSTTKKKIAGLGKFLFNAFNSRNGK